MMMPATPSRESGRQVVHADRAIGVQPTTPATPITLRGLLSLADLDDRVDRRLAHTDLLHMSPLEQWAEARLVAHALARLVASRRRPRLIWHTPETTITDRGWLLERLRRLRRMRRRAA